MLARSVEVERLRRILNRRAALDAAYKLDGPEGRRAQREAIAAMRAAAECGDFVPNEQEALLIGQLTALERRAESLRVEIDRLTSEESGA